MKSIRHKILSLTAIALSVIVLTACGKGGKKNSPDSVADSSSVAEEQIIDSVATFYLTPDGIGPIRIGMPVDSIPEMVAALYDHVTEGADEIGMARLFYNHSGVSFTALDFMEGKVDLIYLDNAYVKVATPEGDLTLGDEFSRVLLLPDCEAIWQDYDEASGIGMWYWNAGEIWYAVDQSTLTDSLKKKLYDSSLKPTKSDFDENVRIGYIGTGLPF